MFNTFRSRLVGAGIVVAAVALAAFWTPVFGRANQEGKSAGAPHYTVVMTEGHNLLVTDNSNNTVYFYTIDKDKPIGSPLKLRASVDLVKVGEQEIHITAHNLEK